MNGTEKKALANLAAAFKIMALLYVELRMGKDEINKLEAEAAKKHIVKDFGCTPVVAAIVCREIQKAKMGV